MSIKSFRKRFSPMPEEIFFPDLVYEKKAAWNVRLQGEQNLADHQQEGKMPEVHP